MCLLPASHEEGFSNLLYILIDIRRRLSLIDWGMEADFIAAFVASCMYFGMGLAPLDWVGQAGAKCSFGLLQHGHMNQYDDLEAEEIDLGGLGWLVGCVPAEDLAEA